LVSESTISAVTTHYIGYIGIVSAILVCISNLSVEHNYQYGLIFQILAWTLCM